MLIHRFVTAFLFAGIICNVTTSVKLFAECPCNKGRSVSGFSGSGFGGFNGNFSAAPEYSYHSPTSESSFESYGSAGFSSGTAGAYQDQYFSTGYPGVGPGFSGATATSWQPPPGTLGRTYQIKSRPIPVSMHPRSAIVDVRVKGAKNVLVHEMNNFRTQDYLTGFQDHEKPEYWHFSTEPLIPGLSHIYRIEARFDDLNGRENVQERYVRLIMGRVIELDFNEVR